jgi:hypothetical protein
MVEMTFAKQTPKTRTRRKKNVEDGDGDEDDTPPKKKQKTSNSTGTKKGKMKATADNKDPDNDNDLDHMYVDNPRPRKTRWSKSGHRKKLDTHAHHGDDTGCETIEAEIENPSDEDSDEVTFGWSMSFREEPTTRRKTKPAITRPSSLPVTVEDEIVILSD